MAFVVSLYTDICVLRELLHCRYAAISLSNFATEEDEKEHDGSRSRGNWVVPNLYGQLCDRYVIVLITSKEHIYWELPIYSVEREREREREREKERELITNRKTAKRIAKTP